LEFSASSSSFRFSFLVLKEEIEDEEEMMKKK